MRELKLSRNSFSDEDVRGVLAHLRHNTTLEYISFAHNRLTRLTLDLLLDFLRANKSSALRKVNLCQNAAIVTSQVLGKLQAFQEFQVDIVTS